MNFTDWLTAQITAPGALASFVQSALLAIGIVFLWRTLRRDRGIERARIVREADALAELADYACDQVIAVSDALGDEVSALEFVERFDARGLAETQTMLAAIRPRELPTLALFRPLFDLLWAVDVSLRDAQLIRRMIDDPERLGWREVAEEMTDCAERAAVAADLFRKCAREARRG